MDLVMTFPDISLSFTIPKSTSKSHVNLKIPFNLPSAYLNPIPKIIHSALVGKANVTLDTIPEAISESVASFRLQNPDYQYRFIGSLEEMRKDILDFEGNATLHAFDTLTPMAYKVDLWRIVMMFVSP